MLTFIYRFILNLSRFLVIELPLQLAGALILLPLCAFYDIGKLPRVFRYFDSADPFVGRDVSVITLINNDPIRSQYYSLSPYWTKYNWLAWRNPLNYFGYVVLGINVPKEGMKILRDWPCLGPDIGTSKGDQGGLFRAEVDMDGRHIYEYYLVKPYTSKLLAGKCFRLRMGWKIGHPHENKPGSHIQQAFIINPLASYEGQL